MIARLNEVPPESLVEAIERWLAAAPARLLRVLCGSGFLGAMTIMVIDATQWPVALGLFAVAAGGEWGLLDRRLNRNYSRPLLAAEMAVAALALLAAVVTIFVALFVFLGPAPHF